MRVTDIKVGQIYAAVLRAPRGRPIADRPAALAAQSPVIKVEVLQIARRSDAKSKGKFAVCRIDSWEGEFSGVPLSPEWLPLHPSVQDRWLVKPAAVLCSWEHYETMAQRHRVSKLQGVALAKSIGTLTEGTANYDAYASKVVVSLSLEQASALARRLTTTKP